MDHSRNALTQSAAARTLRVNGEGSFNPSAPAKLDVQPLAIPPGIPRLRDADSWPVEYLANFAYDACA